MSAADPHDHAEIAVGRDSPADPRDPWVTDGDVRAAPVYLLSRRPWVRSGRRLAAVVSLVALDVCGLIVGLYLALIIRALLYGNTLYWNLIWTDAVGEWIRFLAPVTVLVLLQAGMYRGRERRPGAGRILSSLVMVALIVLAFGLGTGYEFTTTGLIPTAIVTASLAMTLLRAAYDSVSIEIMRKLGQRRRVVLVGHGENLERIDRQLSGLRGGIAYELVGVVSRDEHLGSPVAAYSLGDLAAVLDRTRPDEVILTESDFDEMAILSAVDMAHAAGVRVRLAPSTTEILVHDGEYVPGQGVPLFELRPPVLAGIDFVVKRVFDVVVAFLGLLLLAPLWLLVALAVKIDSRGPVFFVDDRMGVGEREFGMLKFRTMVAGAAGMQPELEARNEASGALFKIRDDPRVTRVGRALRRFSIDELPQLLNVLRGQMSLVGPRPLPRRDHELLEEWHKARYKVLPGMTGLWQISGRSGLAFDDLVRLDFTYLENWSIWLDVTIIAKTLPAVLAARGAY
jgi:exopolysaccharide biosynthesis polyprenyl glycosylphosphotransferase